MRIWIKVLSLAILAIGTISVMGAGANTTAYTVNGTVISWTGTGWFQVQLNGGDRFPEICSGTDINSCDVGSPGSYILINHSTGQRSEDIIVTDDQRPGDGQPGANTTAYTVNGTVISWTGTGWFQVQLNGGEDSEVCSGTDINSCDVGSPGSYILINHSTGQRSEDIIVTDDQRPGDGQPGDGEAPIRNPNFPSHSRTPNFDERTHPSKIPGKAETGLGGVGNFRVNCQYSHFAYDDPIRSPRQPGQSEHLHMFFGNTDTDAFTTKDNITDSGNGTCHGYELNRSAYWVPALLDQDGKAVVPKDIVIYYKSRQVTQADEVVGVIRKGWTAVAGNTEGADHVPSADSQHVFWSCGKSGERIKGSKSGTIPLDCKGEELNATIYFGQCWDGINRDSYNENGIMDNAHIHKLEWVDRFCPKSSHSQRLPELGILLYYPPVADTTGWRLSSDGPEDPPGSTLHADFIAGWEKSTIEMWTKNCLHEVGETGAGRNCTVGELGTEQRLDAFGSQNYRWDGPYRVTPPDRG